MEVIQTNSARTRNVSKVHGGPPRALSKQPAYM